MSRLRRDEDLCCLGHRGSHLISMSKIFFSESTDGGKMMMMKI